MNVHGSESAAPVALRFNDNIARLTLSRPQKHNALDLDTIERIEAAIASVAENTSARVLILDALPGRTFCAGASLTEIESGHLTPDRFHDMLDVVSRCAVPTVAAISGNCHGGGGELPLACDFRVGIDSMHLQVPATRIGLCYPPRGIQRYAQRLGMQAAKRILLAGEHCSAAELQTMGYLDRICGADQLDGFAVEIATSLASLAPLSVRATKDLINRAAENRWEQPVAEDWVTLCDESDDLKRGLTAARLKERADFQGN